MKFFNENILGTFWALVVLFFYYPLKYKKPPITVITTIIDGGDKGIRTPDLLTASPLKAQLYRATICY